MGILRRDNKVKNIDHDLLSQVRGCRMRGYTRAEAFESIRDVYTLTPDSKIWQAIDYVYDDE